MGFFDNIRNDIRQALSKDVDDLIKSDANQLPDSAQHIPTNDGAIGQKAILVDPFFDQVHQHFIFRNKLSRISNKTLKDVSVRDWLVSAMIQARCDTMLRFARPQRKQFEMGYKIYKRDRHEDISAEDKENMANLENFIYNCGRSKDTPPGDEMLFGEFLKLCTRDALTFGHISVEKVLTRKRSLHRFRPVPAESVYIINQKTSAEIIAKEIEAARTTFRMKQLSYGGNNPEAEHQYNEPNIDYFKYVQMSYDNRVLAAFGDEDMVFKLFNGQNFSDSMGYCYVPDTAYVLLADGSSKLIENLSIGDMVITHDGTPQEVYELKKREYDGEVINIGPNGMMSQVITPEHPLYIVSKRTRRSVEHKRLRGESAQYTPEWMSAKDVKRGDYITVPKLQYDESYLQIDMAQYGFLQEDGFVVANKKVGYIKYRFNRYLPLDADLAWLIGLYAGDGCTVGSSAIRFDLGIHEENIVNRVVDIANKIGVKAVVKNDGMRGLSQIHISSTVLVRMMRDMCPGDVYNKMINPKLFNMSRAARVAFISGHIDSDGYCFISGDANSSSVSYNLVNAVAIMANSLGYLTKIKKYNKISGYNSDRPTFVVQYPRKLVRELLTGDKCGDIKGPSRKVHYREDDKNFYVSISKITRKHHSGSVHNIEVRNNHSYLANQAVSHNCYGPLELAIINVTNHLNIDNYNAQFFTHGYAARGILHLKGTVTQAQLAAFRRQFYNNISGTQNAWRTPIVAGMDEVQWVPLSGSAKEMEYLNYNSHIMRALCSQFQIDPLELGLDYLISGTGRGSSMQAASNEAKINYSRERGLIPILMMFEDMINSSVIPAIDKELAARYEFKFTGYDDESPQTNVALQQAQMTVFSTMNDLLRSEGKESIKHIVADLPLNQAFWGLVEKNMTRGEIREAFFGDKNAKGKRELAYLGGDAMYIAWQQMLLTLDRAKKQDEMQKQQMQQEQQSQEHEQQIQQGQHQREQETHDTQMEEHQNKRAHAAADQPTLKDMAKEVGAASKPLNIDGQPVANPINVVGDE